MCVTDLEDADPHVVRRATYMLSYIDVASHISPSLTRNMLNLVEWCNRAECHKGLHCMSFHNLTDYLTLWSWNPRALNINLPIYCSSSNYLEKESVNLYHTKLKCSSMHQVVWIIELRDMNTSPETGLNIYRHWHYFHHNPSTTLGLTFCSISIAVQAREPQWKATIFRKVGTFLNSAL